MHALRVLTIASLLLSFCVDCYFLSRKLPWDIHLGIKPKDYSTNLGFYCKMAAIIFMLLSIFIIVVEILNIADTLIFEDFDVSIQKSIIVLCIGLGHLGMCGDLGFSSGIITLASAIIWVIIGIYTMANGSDS